MTGFQQKRGNVSASKAPHKTGTVQKSNGAKPTAKACDASQNSGLKKDAVLVPNKTTKTGMIAEAAIWTLPQWGPRALALGKAIIWGIAGVGVAVIGDTVGEFVASTTGDGEERVDPEGGVSEENQSPKKNKKDKKIKKVKKVKPRMKLQQVEIRCNNK